MERAAYEKHELVDGEIFAMAGCNRRHDTIAGNVFAALHQAVDAGPCEPFTSDMRVHIPADGSFHYPDGSVACGAEFRDGTEDVLLNPCVIFEVLSDSTEAYDRGDKFGHYRSIPSLKDYVLVSQHKMLIEHFSRQADGRWLLEAELRGEGVLRLTAVPVEIPIEAVYRRVVFPGK